MRVFFVIGLAAGEWNSQECACGRGKATFYDDAS
jgi:hypothetical protein